MRAIGIASTPPKMPPSNVVPVITAMMIAQEWDYDPRRTSPEFTANVRAMIERRSGAIM